MLYCRLLIGILNTSLGNTVKKLSIYKIFPQLYNFFYSYHVYFILWIKSVLQNGGAWVVCWRNNCLIPNIKTDKKVTFLALVQVLQWNSHPRFLIYVHSKWLKTFLIFGNGTKTCATANLYSSRYYQWKKKLPGNCTLQYVVMLMIMSYISKLKNSLQKQKWN